jgi:ferrous iron transport protein A
MTLNDAPVGTSLKVIGVTAPSGRGDWLQRLEELGFLPGEAAMVMARFWPGGDPLAVRIGLSQFALRRAEAACVRVDSAAKGQATR